MVRQERWEVSEVARWEDSEVARWEGSEVGKVRQKGGRYLVLFKSGGHKMSPRFHLFVSDVNQGNEGVGWVQDFLAWPQGWKDSP